MTGSGAVVERVEGGIAWVRPDPAGGCGRCSEPGGCGSTRLSNSLGDLFGTRSGVFPLANDIGALPGERVTITIPEGAPLRAALSSYGLGAACLLAGAGLGFWLWPGDAGAGGGAAAGLCTAILLNRGLLRSRRWRSGLKMDLAGNGACAQARSET